MRKVALIVSLMALLSAAVAGCGSSSKSKGTGPPASSTPATPSTPSSGTTAAKPGSLQAQWQVVCAQLQSQAPSAKTLPQAGALLEKLLPKFQAIKPPAAQQADYAKLLAGIQQDITALKANDKAAARKLAPANVALEHKLGLPKCA